jgi:hypothetical protein
MAPPTSIDRDPPRKRANAPVSTRVFFSQISGLTLPSAAELPKNVVENQILSSARIPMTVMSQRGWNPLSFSALIAISPATTPAAPSKLPPFQTESRCDPMMTRGRLRSRPAMVT